MGAVVLLLSMWWENPSADSGWRRGWGGGGGGGVGGVGVGRVWHHQSHERQLELREKRVGELLPRIHRITHQISFPASTTTTQRQSLHHHQYTNTPPHTHTHFHRLHAHTRTPTHAAHTGGGRAWKAQPRASQTSGKICETHALARMVPFVTASWVNKQLEVTNKGRTWYAS